MTTNNLLNLIKTNADIEVSSVGDCDVSVKVSWEGISSTSTATIRGGFEEFKKSRFCKLLVAKTCVAVRRQAIAIAYQVNRTEFKNN